MSIKISELPSAETLGENDIVPIVQDGTTKKITAGTFKAENATVINSSSTNATPAGAKAVYDYAAPISHADENTTYGQGTESKYGHCKTINNLTASEYTAGEALSSYQGKLLKDAIDGLDEDKQDVIDALHKIGSDSVEDGTFEGNEQSNRFIKVITDDRSLEVKDFATGTYLLKAGVDLALNGILPAEIVNFGNDTLMITKATDTAVFYYIFDNTDNEDHCRLLYGYENITERTGTHKYLNIDDIPSTAGGNIDITNGVISTIGNTIRTLDATNDIIINNLNVGVYQVRDNATYKFKSGTGNDYVSFTISSQTFMVVSQIEAELPVPTTPKYYYIVDIQNGDVHYGYCKWLNSTQGYSGTHYIIDQSELVDKDYLETKLAEKQAEIDQLYDQIPTATATGDNINIQDSSNLPIKEFDLLGNATQQTFTLLDYIEATGTQYIDTGVKAYGLTTNFEIKFAPTRLTNYNFIFSARESSSSRRFDIGWGQNISASVGCWFAYNTYNAVDSLDENFAVDNPIIVKKQDSEVYVDNTLKYTFSSLTDFTTPVNVAIFANNTNGTIANYAGAKLYYFKIYNGSTLVRDFIPAKDSNNVVCLYDKVTKTFFYNKGTGTFTAGTSQGTAPTPEAPQDIHVVTGDNTLVKLGKNLLQIKNTTRKINEVTFTPQADGSILVNGTATGGNATYPLTRDSASPAYSDGIAVIGGQSYTISKTPSDLSNILFQVYYDDGSTKYSTGTFTPLVDCKIGAYIRVNNGATINNVKIYCQIERGSTATPYEPYTETRYPLHLGNLEFASRGSHIDLPFKAVQGNSIYDSLDSTTKASLTSGAWYKQGNIGKYKFTGNENFTLSQTTNVFYLNNAYDNCLIDNVNIPYCDILKGVTYKTNAADMGNETNNTIAVDGGTNKRFYFKTNAYSTASELATGLTDKNVYWVYATPTYTEITDTTLISQLENVLKMHTNKNVTNAWIEPSGTNAQAGLTLTYRQDLATLIAG